MVRDLIIGFVPDAWLHSLDYKTLERVEGSYITEDFRGRADDIVWRIKLGGEWVYLYLLIEFQSTVDKYMALRMMVYQGLLYQDLIKQGAVLSDGRLPPVLPIVLYNGSQRWTAATDVFDLIPPVPGLVEQFKPRAAFLLVDDLQGLRIMLSEQLEVWARQYEARGEARGEIMALQKLLSKRFGVIPNDVLAKISSASQEQVDSWLDQVLDACSLGDLFGPTTH